MFAFFIFVIVLYMYTNEKEKKGMKEPTLTCRLILTIEYANMIYDFDELNEERQSMVLRYMKTLKAEQDAEEKYKKRV